MASLDSRQMAQVQEAIDLGIKANNLVKGGFFKQASDKIAEMEKMRDAIIMDFATQTSRIGLRVRKINVLKDNAFA